MSAGVLISAYITLNKNGIGLSTMHMKWDESVELISSYNRETDKRIMNARASWEVRQQRKNSLRQRIVLKMLVNV